MFSSVLSSYSFIEGSALRHTEADRIALNTSTKSVATVLSRVKDGQFENSRLCVSGQVGNS